MKRFICILLLLTILLGASHWAQAATSVSASSEEIKSLFYSRSDGVHPRLYATEDRFTELRQRIHTDPYLEKWFTNTYEYYTEQHYDDTLIWERTAAQQVSSGKRFNDLFDGIGRIANTAFLYRITGESRFAECALKDMLMLAEYDWDYNFLEMAQISYAMGLGYDWLYDYMTQAQRKTVCDAIYYKAIEASYTLPSDQTYWKTISNNLNSWTYGGLTIGALAIFESYPDRCTEFLSEMVTNIQNSMSIYAPCGSYPEGPDYAVSGLSFTVYTLEACLSVLGTEFGLSKINGFRESGEYLPAINGYTASFNYGDGGVYMHNTAALFWYANHFQKPELALWQRNLQTHDVYTHDAFFAMLWYNPDMLKNYEASQAQKDYLLRDDVNYQSVATFRSDASSPQQIYAGIKSGYIRSSHHTDTDIGTFVLDAMGVRWFCDLGSEDYSILNNSSSGYWDWTEGANRWKHYRKRAEGQNTLVINPSTAAGQDTTAKCQISDYQSLKDGGYAVVDMTDAYDIYGASSVKRGLMLFDDRSRVLLRDEIVCNSSSTVYWFAHTQASISVSEDGKTATLTRGGKTLLAQIASPSSATFTSMSATPLTPLNPSPDGQKSNASYRKLVIKLTNVQSAQISVVFTPIVDGSDGSETLPNVGISQFSSYLQSASTGSDLPINANGEYEISTPEQFVRFATMVNSGTSFSGKTVKLMKDLDLQGWTVPPVGGGTEDGTSGKAFSGIFDGGNHVIRNLFLYRPKGYYVALFGSISGATLKNLGVESGKVFGYDKASGLVGMSMNSTVSSCYSKANVNGTGPYHAGLIAQIVLETNVQNCYFNGSVNGTNTTGGLVGYVGSNSTLNMSNCYHAGLLTGSDKYTGMIGFYHASGTMTAKKISVSNCYSTQPLKGTAVAANTAVETYSVCGTITPAKMVSAAIYIGGDFVYDCEWENDGYPVLSRQCDTTLPQDGVLTDVAQLRLMAWQVNSGQTDFAGKSFYLSKDLDLEGREWIPIGGNTTSPSNHGKAFAGSFDGQGHSIKNLQISSGNCFVALFGRLTGSIRNLGVESGQVSGYHIVAGISAYGGELDCCYNSANIQGHTGVGGVVAMANNEVITNCYNRGSVSASYLYGGGIVAYFTSGANGAQLKNCYNIGKVSAATSAGDIVGDVHSNVSTLTITNSYSISDNGLVGGNGTQFLSGCSRMTASQLQAAASTLGSAYCADETGVNLGYPVLTWQTASRASSDALYFDFRNDTTALAKYAGDAYGGYNFDLAEHWVTESSGTGNGDDLVKMDSAVGVMHVNLSLRDGTNGSNNTTSFQPVGSDKRFAWSTQADRANELRFDPQRAQILQVRLKLSDAEQLGDYQPRLNLYYLPKGAERWSQSNDEGLKECFALFIPSDYLQGGACEGQYVTLTVSLNGSKFSTYEQIKGLHFQFSQLHGGTATIDYIYIGSQSSAPVQDHLFFGFTDSESDRLRYATKTYSSHNYDRGYWGYNYKRNHAPAFDTDALYFYIAPTTTNYVSDGVSPYVQTTDESMSLKNSALNYVPDPQDYVQIRFKLENCAALSGSTPQFCLHFDTDGTGIMAGCVSKDIPMEHLTDGQYFVLTKEFSGTESYTSAQQIKSIRGEFRNIHSAPNQSGRISIDYLYIGPESGLPTPQYTVTFKDADGKVLATQTVHQGEAALYSGTTPTKTYDGDYHYTFKGWDKSLTNITADMTVTAQFSPVSHSYTLGNPTAEGHTATCFCGYTRTEEHTFSYNAISSNDYHERTCACGYEDTVDHVFENGTCICGETEVTDPKVADLKIGVSLNLASDISINYAGLKSQLDEYDSFYMECIVPVYQGSEQIGEKIYILQPEERGSYYYFVLEGLLSMHMNDDIVAILHLTKDGEVYVTPDYVYSVATYAYRQLDKSTTKESLKKLCANLLQYGAEAQTWKGYRTDALANAEMTDAHKAYLTDIDTVTFQDHKATLDDFEGASVKWMANALSLENKVVIRFIFKADGYTGDPTKLSLRTSYTNCRGDLVEEVIEGAVPYPGYEGFYAFDCDKLPASEMRSVVSAVIYEGETRLSQTRQYSIDSYGVGKNGITLTLCQAMVAYGDSAAAYFAE